MLDNRGWLPGRSAGRPAPLARAAADHSEPPEPGQVIPFIRDAGRAFAGRSHDVAHDVSVSSVCPPARLLNGRRMIRFRRLED